MTGLFDARDSGNLAIARSSGKGPPATLGESALSSAEDILANDLSISEPMLMREAYDQYLDGLERQTGRSFANPIDVPSGPEDFQVVEPSAAVQDLIEQGILVSRGAVARPKPREQREAELLAEIQALAEEFQDIDVLSPEQIRESVVAVRAGARERRADVGGREGGFGTVAAFATGAAVFISDPPVLASMAFGAGASSTILRAALVDAGIAATVEVPIQATVQAARARLGEETSLREAALNVATVGAGGFFFSGLLRAGARGTKSLVKTVQDRNLARTQAQKDALAYLERKADLDSQTPFEPADPVAMAEHQAKVSEAEIAVREGRAVPDTGPPASVPRRRERPAPSRPATFETGPLADFSKALEKISDDLADRVRAEAAVAEAEARVGQMIGRATDEAEAAELFALVREPPPEPKGERLLTFLQREGGLKDADKSLRSFGIKPKSRPGLINNKAGLPLDEAGLRAFEAGFFSERPTIGELLDAIGEDFNATPARLREADQFAADASDEIRRFADEARADLETVGVDLARLSDAEALTQLQEVAARSARRAEKTPAAFDATERAVSDARAQRATLEDFEAREQAFDAALERQVRDEFEIQGRLSEKIMVEDEAGNLVARTARDVLDDLDDDEQLLNEFKGCLT